MNETIPVRSSIGPLYQASKWQTCHVLIEAEEMQQLFVNLGDFYIVPISGLISIGHEIIQKEDFLSFYHHYVGSLKSGEIPSDGRMRTFFSAVFTVNLEALYAVNVNKEQCIVKIKLPVVQLQAHRFDYSEADGKFRSMVLGYDSIYWGVQFSYPHLYQDENLNVHTVKENAQFPNSALFKRLQQWVRTHTIATPFEKDGKKINVPIRLGKQCLNWINNHPQLKQKGLRVT